MIKVGYWLASELHSPNKLVSDAKRAEERGFEYAMISDHYHPWLPVKTSKRLRLPLYAA